MSVAIASQPSLTTSARRSPSMTRIDSSEYNKPFDTINLAAVTPDEAHQRLSQAATTTGVALLSNISIRPPIAAIQRLFARLYSDHSLVSRLNATYPKRGVFKDACQAPGASPLIDQKTTIDLSVSRLQCIREMDATLVESLGDDFEEIIKFYTLIETDVLPIVTRATSNIGGIDLETSHNGKNNHLRLIDYFPCPEPSAPRCGEHTDYNTYTIVFQDGNNAGLEFDVEGVWTSVPANTAVISWGWCAAVMTNETVKAAKHRILRTSDPLKRRTTAVIFVAPDLDTALKPMNDHKLKGEVWCRDVEEGGITVGDFKEIISKKWRRREGTEPGEVVQGAQDLEIQAFLKPSTCGR